jgi:adenylate kinase family enzyme
MLQEADAIEKAHPGEKGKPIRESEALRKAAALRLMGDRYQETEPLLVYYRERGLLREVDGTGLISQVFQRVISALGDGAA